MTQNSENLKHSHHVPQMSTSPKQFNRPTAQFQQADEPDDIQPMIAEASNELNF